MRSVPLTLRSLVLVPLLAVAVDQARATFACGARAETCLDAAGRGWLGMAGVVLLGIYAVGLGFWVGCLARGGGRAARGGSTAWVWLVSSVGVAAVCAGQALLVGAVGEPSALGGGWLELLALCVPAGGVIALALRAAPAAAALVQDLRPAALRLDSGLVVARSLPVPPARAAGSRFHPATAGRAPPAF
jgi:hypothetical protein